MPSACSLCNHPEAQSRPWSDVYFQVTCRTCGVYRIQHLFFRMVMSFESERCVPLSWATRNATERGEQPDLWDGNYQEIINSMPHPTPVEQMDLVLDYLERKAGRDNLPVPLDPKTDYPIAYAQGMAGMGFVMNALQRKEWIFRIPAGSADAEPHAQLTMAGYERLEARRKQPRGITGWDRVDRCLKDAEERLSQAKTEEQFQSVGHLCRETLISLGQAVYDPGLHPTTDGTKTSPTDAVRMLDAYIAKELQGRGNAETRAVAKKADALADALQHKRTADFRTAALCLEATRSLVEMIAIIAGKRDRA